MYNIYFAMSCMYQSQHTQSTVYRSTVYQWVQGSPSPSKKIDKLGLNNDLEVKVLVQISIIEFR